MPGAAEKGVPYPITAPDGSPAYARPRPVFTRANTGSVCEFCGDWVADGVGHDCQTIIP